MPLSFGATANWARSVHTPTLSYLLPGGWAVKNSLAVQETACNTGDPGLLPGLEDPMQKEMATHSSILAWRIPWMEEPAGLQSMGLPELDMT